MLHGIYGRGRNWLAIAKGLVAARPDYACVLVDLPHHGGSAGGAHGDTIQGVATDVAAWCDAEGLAPAAILGHSFGGKVALAMADAWRDRSLQIWVIDSTPDTRPPSGSAWDLLQTVRRLPGVFPSRDSLVGALTAEGWAPGVAQWMATNLEREDGAFVWRLEFNAMERLLRDFFATDLWSVVEHAAPRHTLHFIKASESTVMSEDAVRRAEAAVSGRVRVHRLAGGHWIHAESPDVIVDLLAKSLES
jgi:esterase